jgi:hypothetical protein
MNSRDIGELHNHMNSLNPAIKFANEIEEEHKLPSLNVEIMKKPKGDLETSVYRKKMDSGRYFHFSSNHHKSVKGGATNTLLLRAETHCSTKDVRDKEMACVKETLMKNGYPYKEIKRLGRRDNNGMKKC